MSRKETRSLGACDLHMYSALCASHHLFVPFIRPQALLINIIHALILKEMLIATNNKATVP